MKQVTHTEFKAADDAYEVEQDLTIETLFETGQTTYEYTIQPCFPVHHGSCGACLLEFLLDISDFEPFLITEIAMAEDASYVTLYHAAFDFLLTLTIDEPASWEGNVYVYTTVSDRSTAGAKGGGADAPEHVMCS